MQHVILIASKTVEKNNRITLQSDAFIIVPEREEEVKAHLREHDYNTIEVKIVDSVTYETNRIS